jgi:hypothetical protein
MLSHWRQDNCTIVKQWHYKITHCCILWCINVQSNIHSNQKTIRSILLASGKVASVLISTPWKHMGNHCHLVYVYVTVRTTCYMWKEQWQPIGIIIYQYYTDQYVCDNIFQIQCPLIQHRPYVHAKHMISCHVGPLILWHLQFHNFISLHYEVVYIIHVQRLAHFYEHLQYGALM